MMGEFRGIPIELLLAIWTAAVAVAGWFARRLFRALRWSKEWEWSEIRMLRKAIDRLRRRENAYATGFELVLIVMPPELTRDQRQAIRRARQLFETALLHGDEDEGG
ncbi:MAG: hypothetical protein QOH47_800 [Sphingomonadales bacterium]|jgi:hypothetical protein|nr:hypothetical protein [Sphingomonadales bacterium]